MKNKRYLIFIILVWIVLIVPFAGMTFWPTNTTSENTVLAEWPAIKNEDGWNKDYLSEMGEYFEDHFAFRQYFVTAERLRARRRSRWFLGRMDGCITVAHWTTIKAEICCRIGNCLILSTICH